MKPYRWKTCQGCGGETRKSPTKHEHEESTIKCRGCGYVAKASVWDQAQFKTRARKRFELVVSIVSDWTYGGSTPKMSRKYADKILNELYGTEPE